MSATNYPTLRSKAAIDLVEEHVRNMAEVKRLEERTKVTKAELIALMKNAPVVFIGARTVSLTKVAATPGRPARKITTEMVGQELPATKGRSASTRLDVE